MGDLFVLYESASGYALLKTKPLDALGLSSAELAATVADLERFSKVATLQAFRPFTSAADALEQINAVSEGACARPPSLSGERRNATRGGANQQG